MIREDRGVAPDDLNAPLGQKKKKPTRPSLPIAAPQLLAGVLGLCGVIVAGWAMFANDPLGGQPLAVVATGPAMTSPGPQGAGPARPQGMAQVFESLNIARPEVECLAVGRDGLLEPPLILKGVAQVVMRLGVVGLEFQGLAKAGLGLVEPPSKLEDNPQVIPGLGKVGGQPQRVLVVVDRGFQVLALLVNHPQEEPGLGAGRLTLKDPAKRLLRSHRVSRLQVAAGDR